MTAAEKRHLNRVAALGCVITGEPATIHHVRLFGAKRSHYLVLPLAEHMHLAGYDGSLEDGKESWRTRYGHELYWLGVVDGRLGCWKERLDGQMPVVTL